jgi:hypothetical protein
MEAVQKTFTAWHIRRKGACGGLRSVFEFPQSDISFLLPSGEEVTKRRGKGQLV